MKATWFLAVCFAANAFAADAPAPAADLAEAAKQYTNYAKMLAEPKAIGAQFATLCAGSREFDEFYKKNGPHTLYYVQHYRNPVAMGAKDAKTWPVGSIVMKEKQQLGGNETGGKDAPKSVAGVAGMIKRAAGTHPKSGDWEFFWVEAGKVKTAEMESCAGCHSGAARDYVFTSFPENQEKKVATKEAGK